MLIPFRVREIQKNFSELDKDNNDVSEAKKAMVQAIEKRIQTMINEADVDGDFVVDVVVDVVVDGFVVLQSLSNDMFS